MYEYLLAWFFNSLAAWGFGKGVGEIWESGAKKRALGRVISSATDEFKSTHPEIAKHFYEDRVREALELEAKEILTGDRRPDVQRFTEAVNALLVEPIVGLEEGLAALLSSVQAFARQEPDLVGLEIIKEIVGVSQALTARFEQLQDQLGFEFDVDATAKLARKCAKNDLMAFCANSTLISEGFFLPAELGEKELALSEVASIASAKGGVILEAPPGAGKSTYLRQIAENELSLRDGMIAIILPLTEWSINGRDIFDEFALRSGFRGLTSAHLRGLAVYGRLLICLDDWNEVSGERLERSKVLLKQLQRDYPNVALILATRSHVEKPGLQRQETVTLRQIDESQRAGIINDTFGNTAAEINEQISSSPELDQITRVPLYLGLFINAVKAGHFLDNKEELLGAFISSHDEKLAQSVSSSKLLQGFQSRYLTAISVAMHRNGATSLQTPEMAIAVASTAEMLCSDKQIGSTPHPQEILAALTAHHLLIVRAENASKSYAFQHQQFQEWYASKYIEQQIDVAVADPAGEIANTFRSEIIDVPFWEEALLFAIEHLSRGDDTACQSVAKVIGWAILIDPVIAAEMIWRSSEAVWSIVREEVLDFATGTHSTGRLDLSVTFMIKTGLPEFEDKIWDLLNSDDREIRIGAIRAADPFRPSVLGSNIMQRIGGWSEDRRREFCSEIVYGGGLEGANIGSEIACLDTSMMVKTDVAEALIWRRRWRQFDPVMRSAPEEIWDHFSTKLRPSDLRNDSYEEQLFEAMERRAASLSPGTEQLSLFLGLHEAKRASYRDEIFQLLASEEFPIDEGYIHQMLERVEKIDAKALSDVLLGRLLEGRQIWSHSDNFLLAAAGEKSKEILDFLLSDQENGRGVVFSLARLLGREEVGDLLSECIELSRQIKAQERPVDPVLSARFSRVHDLLCDSDNSILALTCIDHSPLKNGGQVDVVTDVLHRSLGNDRAKKKKELSAPLRRKLFDAAVKWSEVVRSDVEGTRHQLAYTAVIIGLLKAPASLTILKELLDWELERWRQEKADLIGWLKGGRKGEQPGGNFCYTNIYARAFRYLDDPKVVSLMREYLSDPDFAGEAAAILARHDRHWLLLEQEKRGWGPRADWSRVRQNRARAAAEELSEPSELAQSVLDQIVVFLAQDLNGSQKLDVGSMASSVARMNHAGNISTILEASHEIGFSFYTFAELIQTGQVLPADVVAKAYAQALERWNREEWRKRDNWYYIEEWFEIFAFSDRPSELLARASDLSPDFLTVRNFESTVSALGYSPSTGADEVLIRLADLIPHMKTETGWTKAQRVHATPICDDALFAILSDDDACRKIYDNLHFHEYPMAMAEIIDRRSDLREQFIELVRSVAGNSIRLLLGQIAMQSDENIQLKSLHLINDKLRPQVPLLGLRDIEDLVLDRIPVAGMQNAYELHPKSSQSLRRRLFQMAREDDTRRDGATWFLNRIQELRIEYGQPIDEPRHPAIDLIAGDFV